jgi:hypothetical protein
MSYERTTVVDSMEAEMIATALAKIRHLQFVHLPPGYVGLGKNDVEAAGLDVDEVRAWVDQHEGSEERVLHRDRSLRGGRMTARPPVTSTFFQIPEDQLGV